MQCKGDIAVTGGFSFCSLGLLDRLGVYEARGCIPFQGLKVFGKTQIRTAQKFRKKWFYWATVCKTVRPMLSDCLIVLSVCLSVCPVCDVCALWPNGWTDQDETWHAGRPRPWPHCARLKPSSPPQKRAEPPIFGPYLL